MTQDPAPPRWLADLAAAAAGMTVPPLLRPPAGQGRQSAILVLFGPGAPATAGTGDQDGAGAGRGSRW